MLTRSRASVFLVVLACAVFFGLKSTTVSGSEEGCCANQQCTWASQCYDDGACINAYNMCQIDGTNCKWVSCNRDAD